MKSYTKKNGEVVVKEYDQQKYNKNYYEKNKEAILNNTYICICCNKNVNERNRTNHEKTLKHKLYSELRQQQPHI